MTELHEIEWQKLPIDFKPKNVTGGLNEKTKAVLTDYLLRQKIKSKGELYDKFMDSKIELTTIYNIIHDELKFVESDDISSQLIKDEHNAIPAAMNNLATVVVQLAGDIAVEYFINQLNLVNMSVCPYWWIGKMILALIAAVDGIFSFNHIKMLHKVIIGCRKKPIFNVDDEKIKLWIKDDLNIHLQNFIYNSTDALEREVANLVLAALENEEKRTMLVYIVAHTEDTNLNMILVQYIKWMCGDSSRPMWIANGIAQILSGVLSINDFRSQPMFTNKEGEQLNPSESYKKLESEMKKLGNTRVVYDGIKDCDRSKFCFFLDIKNEIAIRGTSGERLVLFTPEMMDSTAKVVKEGWISQFIFPMENDKVSIKPRMEISKYCLYEFIIKLKRSDLVDDVEKMKEYNLIWDRKSKNTLVETYKENFKAAGERRTREGMWENVLDAFKKKIGDNNKTERSLISQLARLKAENWPGTEEIGKNLFLNFQCFLLSSVFFFLIRQ